MKKRLTILAFALSAFGNFICGQGFNPTFAGTYSDGIGDITITELQLRNDGTFKLTTPDPVFPYTYKSFENDGVWISKGDTVVLNPDKKRRHIQVGIKEQATDATDSITIKINYWVKSFEKDSFLTQAPFDFDLMTICINKKNKFYHLVRQPKIRWCVFSPRIKNQVLTDSTNTFKIPSRPLTRIGVFTYGFDTIEWLDISDKQSNRIEIDIIQPIDKERTPRSTPLIIKRNKAYFYTRNGKVDKSLTPLIKKR